MIFLNTNGLFTQQYISLKMFDILDDNSNFSNFSSIPGSRSASMKKLPKKESRPSIFQQQKQSPLSPSKGFDDLINNFLEKQSKGNIFESESFSKPNSRRGKFDVLDSHLEDSSRFKADSRIYSSNPQQLTRSRTLKLFDEEENTPQQLKLNNHFGQTQKTIFNPSKIDDSFVSSRNMKPPMKRRDNMSNISVHNKANDFGMVIPEEDPTISNSSKEGFQPLKSVNRRSSIDARSQINSQDYFAVHQGHHIGSFRQDKVRQQPLQKVSNTQSHLINWFGKQSAKFSPNNTVKVEESKIIAANNQRNKMDEKQIEERIAKSVKSVISDYQKQINNLKQNYQKQITALEQSLEKQILETRQTRDKFFKESSRLIDQQRQRSKKMHDEEINRVKQMHLWQKNQITETLRCEIQSLKNTLSLKNEICNRPLSSISIENQNKQLRLRVWQSSLEQKSRMIERRENQLDLRISQFNLQKMQNDERLRSEQKRIMQMQMIIKKQILTEKKGISEQKYRMANQIGSLELQIFKQKEENQMKSRELQAERQSLIRQKDQLSKISQQIMLNHRENLQNIQEEKEKLSNLELELMKKIRVVQMGAKQLQYRRNNQQEFSVINHQISSKIKQKDRSFLKNRQLNKEVNTKSMSNLNKTKERFYEIELNTKSKINASINDHKKLNLTTYMNRVQKFSKLRE